MNTTSIRRFATSLLLLAGLVPAVPAYARPADPQWRPGASLKESKVEACGPRLERAWSGPRERYVLVGDRGPCPKSAPAPKGWAGPRGTIPVR
jgi:hypothetical protein